MGHFAIDAANGTRQVEQIAMANGGQIITGWLWGAGEC
jgi:hypothetical protein